MSNRAGCTPLPTIRTFSGRYMNLINPDPADVDLESIAHALGSICRFGGHCPHFYSVAEHCVLAFELASADGCDDEQLKAVLMHDASESYLGDMVKPLKLEVHFYNECESKMEDAIGQHFGIDFKKHHDTIKKYDLMMLKAEKEHFWPDDPIQWSCLEDVEAAEIPFSHFLPNTARRVFSLYAKSLLKL